jgi:hypothetical protein
VDILSQMEDVEGSNVQQMRPDVVEEANDSYARAFVKVATATTPAAGVPSVIATSTAPDCIAAPRSGDRIAAMFIGVIAPSATASPVTAGVAPTAGPVDSDVDNAGA